MTGGVSEKPEKQVKNLPVNSVLSAEDTKCQKKEKVQRKKSSLDEKIEGLPKEKDEKEKAIEPMMSLSVKKNAEEDENIGDKVSLSKPLYENLVPKENKEDMLASFDRWERALYDKIHVTSYDAGFTWPTSMLMSQILRWGSEAETEEDLVRMLHWNREFNLYEVCKPYLHDIMVLGKEAWGE